MTIREVELPGVGKKYTLDTQAKGQLVIVLHQSGKREIYHFAKGKTVPDEMIALTAEEAQHVGGILSQTYFQAAPDPSTALVMKELTLEWQSLPSGHPMTGKTIEELAVRKRTGATIVAVLRAGKAIINPEPGEQLRAEDTLMFIGNADQVKKFLATFPLSSSQA